MKEGHEQDSWWKTEQKQKHSLGDSSVVLAIEGFEEDSGKGAAEFYMKVGIHQSKC